MATKTSAALVSSSKLTAAVNKAVAIAAQRHDLAVDGKNLIVNWDIVGRMVKDSVLGQKFATDVAAEVTKTVGVQVQPVTFQVGKQILCGFIEKSRVPVPREWA